MKISTFFKNRLTQGSATALATFLLVGCGPKAVDFSILPASQTAFQGSVTNNKVDFLWVIDNSGSMAPKQTKLSNGFDSFSQVFTSKGFDFHMAILTTDTRALGTGQAGNFQGSPTVITTSTPGFSATFKSNVQVGFLGDSAAKALDAILLGLSSSLLSGVNTGFLRSDAHLAVITLSDADDDDSTTTTSDVITFLNSLKPQKFDVLSRTYKNNYTVSAVVVSPSSHVGCSAPFEDGTKFISLANSTNGSVANICAADFSAGLTTLSQHIAEAITEIPLGREPDASTIQITFNGTLVAQDATNGWTYVSSGQKIVFHGTAIPSDNTNISINYIPKDIIR